LVLFSLVTLFAHQQKARISNAARRAAWYEKAHPTFSDALAPVRRQSWVREATFCRSPADTETVKARRL
jgi:hypothetical protein